MGYGDRRDCRKIDIYVQVAKTDAYKYVASTTWARTCAEAKEHFLYNRPELKAEQVHCMFA